MQIIKRTHLEAAEMVKVTKDNMKEVAEWCGGEIKDITVLVHEKVGDVTFIAQAYIGDFVIKAHETFSVYPGCAFDKNNWWNRDERGNLIKNL